MGTDSIQDSTPDTLAHRKMVQDYANDFCQHLMAVAERYEAKGTESITDYAADFCDDILARAERHDESKLHEPEKERFDYVGTKQHLGKHEYGSDEYKKSLEYLGPALQHHYETNDHHPEHFENGVDGMNLMQVVEMFCDWEAACHRNKNGNIYQSLKTNKERFNLADDLYAAMVNTADIFENKDWSDGLDLSSYVIAWLGMRGGCATGEGMYDAVCGVIEEVNGNNRFSDQVYHIFMNTAATLAD